jgi:hypothetical protein
MGKYFIESKGKMQIKAFAFKEKNVACLGRQAEKATSGANCQFAKNIFLTEEKGCIISF